VSGLPANGADLALGLLLVGWVVVERKPFRPPGWVLPLLTYALWIGVGALRAPEPTLAHGIVMASEDSRYHWIFLAVLAPMGDAAGGEPEVHQRSQGPD
jgi:hypothetical protein